VAFINNYGGVNLYPDPVHLDAPRMQVRNYRSGLVTAIPTDPTVHGGVPGGLIGGSGNFTFEDVLVDDVEMVGFLELDGILPGLLIDDLTATHCLVGNSVPAGSWGKARWKNVRMSWPSSAGPVLNFNGGPYTDWIIMDSVFDGKIGDPENFQGTWGPGNIPESL